MSHDIALLACIALVAVMAWVYDRVFLSTSTKGPPPVSNYDLQAIVDQRRDAVGGDEVTFTFGGEEFSFPHPLLADDDWKEGLAEIQGDVEFGQYVLGDHYERFRELGGRSSYIAILIDQIRKDTQAEDRDGRPTRPSTSSRAQRRRPKQR